MKYLSTYKLFESSTEGPGKYYIKGHYWDYELGYIWTPTIYQSWYGMAQPRNGDASVCKVRVKDDGMSNSLACRAIQPLFKEHIGTSNLNELCMVHLNSENMREFAFLENSFPKKKYFALVRPEGSKEEIIKELPNFKKDYTEVIQDMVGKKLTKKELENYESWHIETKLYDVNGIKIVSEGLAGMEGFILRRDDIEKLLDMTKTYNYYRFKDKEQQLLRIKGKRMEFGEIEDIFADAIAEGIKLTDFNQIGENQVMIKFMKDTAVFNDELVKELSESIHRFESTYSCKFDKANLTRNTMMYVNDSNATFMLRDKKVFSYKDPIDLLAVGEMEYNVHLREHALYLIFNI